MLITTELTAFIFLRAIYKHYARYVLFTYSALNQTRRYCVKRPSEIVLTVIGYEVSY